jgi:NadR type nicotinamide-nucleotide adenylyltransferase
MAKYKRGLVIGKFMPPTAGHLYLIDSAQQEVEELVVIIFWKPQEIIPGNLRAEWLRKLRPGVKLLECTANHKVDFDDEAVWQLWIASIKEICPENIDAVFASEPYGETLARFLGANFVPVDFNRKAVPISATMVRNQPWQVWDYIPSVVRPYFVQKVALVGGESTGKTTLSNQLAQFFGTVAVEEYAREFLVKTQGAFTSDDMPLIAREQCSREDAAREAASRFLFCDTCALTTWIWSKHYFGEVHSDVQSLVDALDYSFYLLLSPDIAWEDDGLRDTPGARDWFFEQTKLALERRSLPFDVVTGHGSDRLDSAISSVKQRFSL